MGWQDWILWTKRLAFVLLSGVFLLVLAGTPAIQRPAGLLTAVAFFAVARKRPVTTAASFYGAACVLGILGTAAGWL